MNSQKGFITKLGELIDQHAMERSVGPRNRHSFFMRLFPTIGNALFSLLLIGGLLIAQNSGVLPLFAAPNAQSASTGTIAYQGRLADASGNPLTDTVNMTFRLYAAASGGAPLWEEQWTGANSVQVSDGLFNVMLGSVNPIGQAVLTGNSNLFLGITVGTDGEMSPHVQLGSVPFATQALTVPDGSITAEKLALAHGHNRSASAFTTKSVDFVPIPNAKVEVTVPDNAKLLIVFAGDIAVNQAGGTVEMGVSIDGRILSPPKIEYVNAPADVRITGSQSVIEEIGPGSHTIQLHLRSNNGVATAYVGHRSLSVLAFN